MHRTQSNSPNKNGWFGIEEQLEKQDSSDRDMGVMLVWNP